MTPVAPEHEVRRMPSDPAAAEADGRMRWIYVGVLVVEAVTLLALWLLQEHFTL